MTKDGAEKMLNIFGLVKMINTNKDQFIQKDEVQKFIKKQKSPSVFNEYLQSINDQVNIREFQEHMGQIAWEAEEKTGSEASIEFKKKKYDKEYEKCSLEAINEMRDQAYRFHGHKTKDKETFNVLFGTLMREAIKEGNMYNVYEKLEQIELKEPITMEFIKEYCKQGGYDFQLPKGVTLSSDIDWSNSEDVFYYLSFDESTFADTPREHLPENYDPQQVFDKGKTLGLGIDEAHEKGYTGKGVSVAICDWQLKPHKDLNVKEYQCGEYAAQVEEYFHASAVTGILAGQQTGVAPDADVYFFAEYQDRSETGGNDMINALKSIIEKNKTLPENQRIRVVSISGPIYGEQEEAQALIKELTDAGVWVLSSEEFWNDFGYLEKKDPMGDADDFNNYQINHPNDDEHPEQGLYVTSGNRTVPDPTNETAYRHDSRASASWAIPVVAGYYALACQADPSMTPEKFKQLAAETARVQESTTWKNPRDQFEGRTEETVPIKIIDINALLQRIEEEKLQCAE